MLLCIDFSGEKAKITTTKKIKGELSLVKSLEINTSDLGEYLESNSKQIKEIRVSGPLENTFHKTFILPDMKSNMLKGAVENEVIKEFGNDYLFEQLDLGEMTVSGAKPNRRIMTAGIERKALEQLSDTFADSKIKPNIFTTHPAALQVLLEKLGLSDDKPQGFVEIAHPRSRIVVFKGKEIQLTRELPLAEKEKDPESSALAKDIYRTLLFYGESYPNQKVTRLVISGNSCTTEIVENLRQKAGVEIILFSPETIIKDIEDNSQIHPGCLGLALLDPGSFHFGFVPFSVQEKKKFTKMVTLLSSAFFGILLIVVLVIFRFSLNLKDLDAYQGGIKGEIKMKEDRMKELSLELVSHSIETSQPHWSEILLELAAAVPTGISLESMTMRKSKKGWRGELYGAAKGPDEITSLVLVEGIQDNFNQSPLFTQVKVTEKKLEGKRITFKITYQLKG